MTSRCSKSGRVLEGGKKSQGIGGGGKICAGICSLKPCQPSLKAPSNSTTPHPPNGNCRLLIFPLSGPIFLPGVWPGGSKYSTATFTFPLYCAAISTWYSLLHWTISKPPSFRRRTQHTTYCTRARSKLRPTRGKPDTLSSPPPVIIYLSFLSLSLFTVRCPPVDKLTSLPRHPHHQHKIQNCLPRCLRRMSIMHSPRGAFLCAHNLRYPRTA